VEGDTAEDEGASVHARVAHAPEERGKIVERDPGAQRIWNVSVHVRASMKQKAPQGALRVQSDQIKTAEDAVRGEKEIEADEETAGARDALELAQRGVELGEIAQAVADEDGVERTVGERQSGGVGADRFREAAASRQMQHSLSDVGRYSSCAREAAEHEAGKITRAAGQIEYDGVLGKRSARDAELLPAAVHAVGECACDEVVARGDGGEHLAHQARIAPLGG